MAIRRTYQGAGVVAVVDLLTRDLGHEEFVDLIAAAETLLAAIAERVIDPGFMDSLPRVRTAEDAAEWGVYAGGEEPRQIQPEDMPAGSLPNLHRRVEGLSRSLATAQTALVGHATNAYETESLRSETLGIPAGKTAYRNAKEFLRSHLQVPIKDIKTHTQRAQQLLPQRTFDQAQILPPAWPVLAQGVWEGSIPAASADHIAKVLTAAQKIGGRQGIDRDVVEATLRQGEGSLSEQAKGLDPDVMRRVSDHWLQWFEAFVDPDGQEPTDAELAAQQGLSYKGRRGKLHHWTVDATDDQHEVLMTLASAATHSVETGRALDAMQTEDGTPAQNLDLRTREQRQLDGLVSALTGALALAETKELPKVSGARPHVAVTIDMGTLLRISRSTGEAQNDGLFQALGPPSAGHGASGGPDSTDDPGQTFTSQAAFTGPINPTAIRRWLCDGTVLPVVLGGEGQVLDVGREQRVFPLRLRRAIAARDGGCAAPGCSMPSPWCEAHHIQYWENGGPTSVDNGTLLCSHHHHAVHKGAWSIEVRNGIPWFIPAPYLDPTRTPQRNVYWRP